MNRTAAVFFVAVTIMSGLQAACAQGQSEDAAGRPRGPVDAYTVYGEGVTLAPDGTWKYNGTPGVFEVDTNRIGSYADVPVGRLLRARVVEIYDGDTITVEIQNPPPGLASRERIRLLGIDTPEIGGEGSTPEGTTGFGYTARDFTAALFSGRTVRLAFESAWRDRFSRLLAYVYLEDGTLVNARILEAGMAQVYRDTRCAFQDELLEIESAARLAGLGIWRSSGSADGVTITMIHNEGTNEYLELTNRSSRAADLSGWYVRDESGTVLTIPDGARLEPGGVLRIYSGAGGVHAPPFSYYLSQRQVWNNSGDTAELFDAEGQLADEYAY